MSPRVTVFLHTRVYNQCGCRLLSLPHKCCIWVLVLPLQPTIRETWTSKERVIVKFWWWQHLSVLAKDSALSTSAPSWDGITGLERVLLSEKVHPPQKNKKSQQFSKHLRNWQHKPWAWNKPSLILSLLIAEACRHWTWWSTADTLSWGTGIGRLKNWTENSLQNRAPREERRAAWVLSRLATALQEELPEGGNYERLGGNSAWSSYRMGNGACGLGAH